MDDSGVEQSERLDPTYNKSVVVATSAMSEANRKTAEGPMSTVNFYEADFYVLTQEQAALLRHKQWSQSKQTPEMLSHRAFAIQNSKSKMV